ncbi:MAG: type II secretion system protein [Chloroflexi bacterium]|nr:type II secretion system protein [Chloroflexota bacterium]MBI4330327.1 type II secretion system protein [Chloroflexota bacterium]
MFRRHKHEKGFTLLELMVVMGVLSVLSGMVFVAISGVKGSSVEAQVKNDADSVKKSVDNFNSRSIKGTFPETSNPFSGGGIYSIEYGINTFKNLRGGAMPNYTSSPDNSQVSKPSDATHAAVDWSATTRVWLKDGTVDAMALVPDFMEKQPESVSLMADEKDYPTAKEFMWLFRKVGGAGGTEKARKVEVYRLQEDSAGVAYWQQVY